MLDREGSNHRHHHLHHHCCILSRFSQSVPSSFPSLPPLPTASRSRPYPPHHLHPVGDLSGAEFFAAVFRLYEFVRTAYSPFHSFFAVPTGFHSFYKTPDRVACLSRSAVFLLAIPSFSTPEHFLRETAHSILPHPSSAALIRSSRTSSITRWHSSRAVFSSPQYRAEPNNRTRMC